MKNNNLIRKDHIFAILIPGLVQYQNDQKEKTAIFIIWIFGLMISWYWYLDDPNNSNILIVASLTYVYSIIDALIIISTSNGKDVQFQRMLKNILIIPITRQKRLIIIHVSKKERNLKNLF